MWSNGYEKILVNSMQICPIVSLLWILSSKIQVNCHSKANNNSNLGWPNRSSVGLSLRRSQVITLPCTDICWQTQNRLNHGVSRVNRHLTAVQNYEAILAVLKLLTEARNRQPKSFKPNPSNTGYITTSLRCRFNITMSEWYRIDIGRISFDIVCY